MINICYLISAICFILGIKMLSHPKTARRGNGIAAIGMLIAIITVLIDIGTIKFELIIIGILIGAVIGSIAAIRVQMTQMPQLVAIFNGFGGAASALIASKEFFAPTPPETILTLDTFTLSTIMFSVIIGTLTFTGSLIAFGKLQGLVSSKPITYPGQQLINVLIVIGLSGLSVLTVYNPEFVNYFYLILIMSAIIGIALTIPIGGADMPVVISLLNSY